MAKQINLTYTKFFTEAIDGVDKGEFQCSFVLNPTRVTEIRDVAAAGEKCRRNPHISIQNDYRYGNEQSWS